MPPSAAHQFGQERPVGIGASMKHHDVIRFGREPCERSLREFAEVRAKSAAQGQVRTRCVLALSALVHSLLQSDGNLAFVRVPVPVAPEAQTEPWLRSIIRPLQLVPEICETAVHCHERAITLQIRYAQRRDKPPSDVAWGLLRVGLPVASLCPVPRLDFATNVVITPPFEVLAQSPKQLFGNGEQVQIGGHFLVRLAPSVRC